MPDYVRLLNGGWAAVEEVSGADEAAFRPNGAGGGTRQALALLDRLLREAPGAVAGPGQAARLTAPDRDRLLAAVYTRLYGDQIQGVHVCRACSCPFDLDFSLAALQAGLEVEREAGKPAL